MLRSSSLLAQQGHAREVAADRPAIRQDCSGEASSATDGSVLVCTGGLNHAPSRIGFRWDSKIVNWGTQIYRFVHILQTHLYLKQILGLFARDRFFKQTRQIGTLGHVFLATSTLTSLLHVRTRTRVDIGSTGHRPGPS